MTESEPILRRPRPQDLEALAQLHWRSWQVTYRPLLSADELSRLTLDERRRHWRCLLSGSDRSSSSWIVEVDRRLVGLVEWSDVAGAGIGSPRVAEVHAIHVEPGLHRRGLGRWLLETAVREMGEAGFDRAILWVLAGNGQARRFYKGAGWRWDGTATVRPMGDLSGLPLVEEVRYSLELTGTR